MDNKIEIQNFLGFVSGEACFSFNVFKNKKTKLKKFIAPLFQIALAKEDYILLKEIKEWVGFGWINKEGSEKAVFRILHRKGCKRLISIIEPQKEFLLGKKKEVYEKWKEIVFLLDEKGCGTQELWDDVIEKWEQMGNPQHSKPIHLHQEKVSS
jgi:transketolase